MQTRKKSRITKSPRSSAHKENKAKSSQPSSAQAKRQKRKLLISPPLSNKPEEKQDEWQEFEGQPIELNSSSLLAVETAARPCPCLDCQAAIYNQSYLQPNLSTLPPSFPAAPVQQPSYQLPISSTSAMLQSIGAANLSSSTYMVTQAVLPPQPQPDPTASPSFFLMQSAVAPTISAAAAIPASNSSLRLKRLLFTLHDQQLRLSEQISSLAEIAESFDLKPNETLLKLATAQAKFLTNNLSKLQQDSSRVEYLINSFKEDKDKTTDYPAKRQRLTP